MKIQVTILLLLITSTAMAVPGDLYIYPANGQDNASLERDRYECYLWAVGETGFDPSTEEQVRPARLVRVPVKENPYEGATVKGTLTGAIAGVAIGDSHESAAVGAIVGTIAGAIMESEGHRQAKEDARMDAEESFRRDSQVSARHADYKRAFSACLEGRGYVVR